MNSDSKPRGVILVSLLLMAAVAGWCVPKLETLRSGTTRVAVLAVGLTVWYSIFQTLNVVLLKREFSVARVAVVFGAAAVFFTLAEIFSKSLRGPLVPISAAAAFAGVAAILVIRRLRH